MAPPELLERILELAGTEMVLVGGQALAFWAAYYRAPAPPTAVTKDVDLLGTRRDAERLARGLHAKLTSPRRGQLTLLAAQVVKDLPGDDYVNIDVLSRVYGKITAEAIRQRSILAETAAGAVRVMHPLDVLQGRLENVHGLAEKRDQHGIAQLELAIRMTRGFLRDIGSREAATPNEPRPVMLRHIGRIETMALSDPGRKAATRYAAHVADAIDPTLLLHVKPFVQKKLPQLLKLMSAARREELASELERLVGQRTD